MHRYIPVCNRMTRTTSTSRSQAMLIVEKNSYWASDFRRALKALTDARKRSDEVFDECRYGKDFNGESHTPPSRRASRWADAVVLDEADAENRVHRLVSVMTGFDFDVAAAGRCPSC